MLYKLYIYIVYIIHRYIIYISFIKLFIICTYMYLYIGLMNIFQYIETVLNVRVHNILRTK